MSLVNRLLGQNLATKILGVLVAFLLLALAAIGLTLYSSWKLEGVAAAINDAGSLRMRSWKIAHDAAVLPLDGIGRDARLGVLERDLADVERVQSGLEHGDPVRPLFIPRDRGIPADMARVSQTWQRKMRPLVEQVMEANDPNVFRESTLALETATRDYVTTIDAMVKKMEEVFTEHTTVLRSYQVALLALAVIGTVVLMRFFFVAVIRPVDALQRGMQRMQGEDFAVRVAVLTNDEFGDLSRGFNRMADHLQGLYATLEQRVADKTRSLADKNRELSILYEISRLLREPVGIEELSRGFLDHVCRTFEADAASVRLFDADSDKLYITTQQGLDADFVETEAILACGDCLCGTAMLGDVPVISDTDGAQTARTRETCQRAGFATVSAIPVNHNKRALGIFNLYFRRSVDISEDDRLVLQSLGQHLGMAIENVRLLSREKEMAVSEERNLIARELHDSIAQGLAFLNLQVQMLEDALEHKDTAETDEVLDMIRRGIQESYDDVRELLGHFRARLPEQDLAAALRQAVERFSAQSGVSGNFTAHGEAPPLPVEIGTQVLYIAQEALSNVRKHAQAGYVQVDLWRDTDGLRLSIRDDGVGFDTGPRHAIDGAEHIGLHIMGERAARIGGELAVRSKKGQGTEVALTVTGHDDEEKSAA
ncbi:HAMP domain-containing protein [Nitrogeniibacter mangrovi]|uniref:Sensor protein n=1 Tax=Nitrogeniibacter mangrovi TaxID=2016596 RepID=A0A6C1B692_9RHOO|nr:type IV pili methyl-accepting chemotaxis transducer N-terminal domain-containing protein [Nitrogeniibacter mangrovi]QID19242.1 HAMP domain-containing protein [Nitrogeniibacter mangrovi]